MLVSQHFGLQYTLLALYFQGIAHLIVFRFVCCPFFRSFFLHSVLTLGFLSVSDLFI